MNKSKILKKIEQGIVEIRLHGRGGQGVVIASKILSKAYYADGYTPQTFPKYGVERRGAPAAAYVRVSKGKKIINLRCEIYKPQHLIVLDPTLIYAVNVTDGLQKGGWIIINAREDQREQLKSVLGDFRLGFVDASHIALKHRLGSRTSPVVNSAILGGVARIFDKPTIESVIEAIKQEVPIKPEENADAANQAYEQIEMIGD